MTRASLLLASAVLVLAACGSDNGEADTSGPASAGSVGVVSPDGSPVTFQPSTTLGPGAASSAPASTTKPAGTLSINTLPGASGGTSSGTNGSATTNASTGSTVTGSATTVGSATTTATTVPATASVTTLAVTTVPTTAAPTTVAVTGPPSTQGAPVCDLNLIITQTETAFEGITPDQLLCANDWSSWSGIPDDPLVTDGYFAVAQWNGIAWQLRNLGTADVCADGGVPADLWPALGCFE